MAVNSSFMLQWLDYKNYQKKLTDFIQIPILTPPEEYILGLHHTAAAVLQPLIPRACMQSITSKAGAIQ